ncbi:hypothetical protein AMAG_08542 [Allomyces macrogynus ATCC 38327]|uniref:Uncharacterized protein n=1 Tax=Allomyces macrogynus (strain ATCC 38327) TaxID=578462 RepID=A0A0L0SLZ9_ALLM3|nr:hypothetical protein AMAG_08542 [Allomyces macrogynus ATCC 38327]|eukprot:KNE63410.1 hypothetical protein AMAG_08542 [Allomyces macrogynus ATCC 38327]
MAPLGRNLPPKEFLQHFWDLASLDETERILAAEKLLTAVATLHRDFQPSAAPAEPTDATPSALLDAATRTLHPHVAYTFTRLVKGLPSSRAGARQGFTLALSYVLRLLYPTLRWPHLNAAIHASILAAPAESGIEEREKLMGRMFAVVAAVQAGLDTAEETTAQDAAQMAEHLVAVANGKSFLREPALTMLFALVDKSQHKDAILKVMSAAVPLHADSIKNPNDLALCFFLSFHGIATPLELTKTTLPGQVRDLLLQTSATAPRLHAVWGMVLARLLNAPTATVDVAQPPTARATGPLPLLDAFWKVIDANFVPSPLVTRQAIALHLFDYLVAAVPLAQVSLLFSRNFVRFIESAVKAKGDLANLARASMTALAARCETETTLVPVVLAHVKPHMLDHAPAGKKPAAADADETDNAAPSKSGFNKLVAGLTDADLAHFVDAQIARAMTPTDDDDEHDRTAALDALMTAAVLTRPASRARVAEYLFSPAHASSRHAASHIHTFLARACAAPEVHVDVLAEIYRAFPAADARVLAWIGKPVGENKKREGALRSLAMAAHFLTADDEASGAVDEIVSVWGRMEMGEKGMDELAPADVLADVLLELTAHASAWLRRLCQQVMAAFADDMSENAFGLMVTALAGESGEEEEDESEVEMTVGTDDEDEDEEEEDEDDEQDEDAMDVDEDEADQDEDSDDDDDAEDDESGKSGRQTQLSNAIIQALQTSGMAQTADDESDMDDDAMLALDGVLASIVQKQRSKSRTTDQLHFQYRIADLLAVYLKHQPEITLVQIRALVERIAATEDKNLATKLWVALAQAKKVSSSTVDVDGEASQVDPDVVVTTLLKGNLAQAHPILAKVFKTFPPSDAVTSVFLKDLKRYKSVIASLAKTQPGTCAHLLAGTVAQLSRKSAKAFQPVLFPLLERLHVEPALQAAMTGPLDGAAETTGPATPAKGKKKGKAAAPAPKAGPTIAGKLAELMRAELAADPKDASLLKITVVALRAMVKAGMDVTVFGEGLDAVPVSKKQAVQNLLREAKKLTGVAGGAEPDEPAKAAKPKAPAGNKKKSKGSGKAQAA